MGGWTELYIMQILHPCNSSAKGERVIGLRIHIGLEGYTLMVIWVESDELDTEM